ncbi:MAG: hypothetical protein JW384_02826 [Nitrosomonadaceae bacterium]|nr:hypothetical protein [Nitrosomonadaceae bacterium]
MHEQIKEFGDRLATKKARALVKRSGSGFRLSEDCDLGGEILRGSKKIQIITMFNYDA